MRVAAIYDIHGNLPALEAVLNEIDREGVDHIVVGGDVVCGPMTAEVMDRLLDLGLPADFICGNAEASVLTEMAGDDHPVPFPEPVREVLRWEAAQLRRFAPVLTGWPKTLRHRLAGLGDVLFCHATPRDLEEIFLESTPEHVLLPAPGSSCGPRRTTWAAWRHAYAPPHIRKRRSSPTSTLWTRPRRLRCRRPSKSSRSDRCRRIASPWSRAKGPRLRRNK